MTRLTVLLLGVAACASSSSSTTPATSAPQSVRVSGGGGSATGTRIDPSLAPHATTVAFPVEDIWRFLPFVWDSLGIPKVSIDPKSHTLSNGGMKIRQRLGKTPLSRFIDCGQTQIGPNADSYEVFLTVTSQVVSAGTGQSTIATVVEAAAKPLNFNQEYSRCSTRGELEDRIAKGIKGQFKP
jgi:hypothetical protein